jgi:hypothetical protein
MEICFSKLGGYRLGQRRWTFRIHRHFWTNSSSADLSTEPQSNNLREQHVDQPVGLS